MIAHANHALLGWIIKHPIVSRLLAFLILITGLVLIAAAPAYAADGDLGNSNDQLDDVTDSHGIPADKYTVLPFDRGDLLNWNKLSNSWWISSAWDFNYFLLKQCIWLFQWTLSFEWVDMVSAPAQLLGDGLESIIGELNIIPLALMIAAVVCGLAIVRGKYASGFLNILISCLFAIAVAAGGVLHNPVESVVGENGALHSAADAGGELAVRITNDGTLPAGSTDDISGMIDQSVSQQLVDIFLRTPTQLVAFGKVLDGNCSTVFDNAMTNVKVGDTGDNSVRDAVSACDPAAAQFIKNPNGQLITLWVVGGAMMCLFSLAIVMVLILFWTVIVAAYKAISLIFKGVLAILPTADRASVWYTAFDVLTALAMVAVSLIFLAAYLRFVIMYMTASAFMGIGQFVLVDALFLGGVILVIRIRKGLKRAGKNMADRLTRLGLGNAASPKERAPISPVQTLASIGRTYAGLKTLGSKIPTRSPLAPQPTPAAPGSVNGGYFSATSSSWSSSSSADTSGPRSDSQLNARALPPGKGIPDAPSGADRVRTFVATGSKTALQVAAVVPTPITPVARTVSAGASLTESGRNAVPARTSAPKSLPASTADGPTPDHSQAPSAAPKGDSAPARFVPSSSVRVVSGDVGPQTSATPIRSDRNEKLRAEITSLRERAARSQK
ncbi:hypothetical protein C5D98_14970 [Rathayibacter rathayi]|uniref:hypothetical protein n=1 Tax=Rathayibacter rathayi TaxID=33887 RepID=UPI000CE76EB3|nr:hypothetical protein [Rathayibacter rathayi]PPG77483.1 hypothetical protein C5C15_09315 [Rathayibacter rathayi]PPG94319.1 hypothetical protein C5C22_09050 [Rathayibacter rathayi]PPI65251.1 hypothetical protein C5D98_14970 [Rathayibacter rathayi]